MRITVVGGTGVVGRHVVDAVRSAGHEPVVAARSHGVDVISGAGLDRALAGAEAVIDVSNIRTTSRHKSLAFFEAASQHLLASGQRAGVRHHVALSIVGIDRVNFGYYYGKRRQEELVLNGPVAATVLRATQFYEFADQCLNRGPGPVAVVPAMRSQPIAAREVADALVALACGPALGYAPELAGPEEHQMVDMVRRLKRARDARRIVFPMELPGQAGRAITDGALLPTAPGPRGRQNFEEWLIAAAASPRAEKAANASDDEAQVVSDSDADIVERLRRVVAALLGTGLGGIAGLHVYWGLGGDAGLRAAIGDRPTPAWIRPAALAVAVLLVPAALSMLERVAASRRREHRDGLPDRGEAIRSWAAHGRRIVALGLLATGVVNLAGRTTLERAGFAPLCLTLAALAAFATRFPAPSTATRLDHWLPRYHVREVHERLVDGDERQALDAVLSQDVVGDPLVRALFRLRRLDATPTTLERFTSSGGFTVLERSETSYVFGEHVRRPAVQIAADFRAEPAGPGRTRLVTETRVLAQDRVSLLVFRAYWLLVGPFSGLIRRRWLHAAATAPTSTPQPA